MKRWLKNYFISHAGNNYKPHSTQKTAMVGMVVLVFLSFLASNLQAVLWLNSDWMISTILPSVIVDLTNNERKAESLVGLQRNAVLDAAAKLKAEDMAKNEYFAHYSPTGVSPWYWFAQVNYNFVHAGENLAIHFSDSGEVVEAWMNSPTHRQNIMDGKYREIGVGTAEGVYDGYKTVYVVQLFGTPAATPAVASATAGNQDSVLPVVLASATDEVEVEEAEDQINESAIETENVVASEAVTVTEESTVILEPVETALVLNETPLDRANEPELVTKIPTTTTPVEQMDTEVIDVASSETGVTLFSNHITTTTGRTMADVDSDFEKAGDTPYIYTLATSPQSVLQILYTFIALFVVGTLLMTLYTDIRNQQKMQIAYSVALLLLMVGLMTVQTYLTTGAVIL
ncbi:hypothetical protein KC845_03495 [Candidatus Kaiserbacteria bacterium]|nr:hypothetical protein [Candidatus Kaiserbacteria bacterium]